MKNDVELFFTGYVMMEVTQYQLLLASQRQCY